MFILGHQWVNSERKVSKYERHVFYRHVQCVLVSYRLWSVKNVVENFNHYSEVGAGTGTE
ncbi:unnamed protein product [Brassica rapa subsp. trilocularis]